MRLFHLACIFFSAAAVVACSEDQYTAPQTERSDKLAAKLVGKVFLPEQVKQIECWGRQWPDKAVCNIHVATAASEPGETIIGWDRRVRGDGLLDFVGAGRPFIEDTAFDLALISSSGFVVKMKRLTSGISVEVRADENALPFEEAAKFSATVLPLALDSVSARLEAAFAKSPAEIKKSWLE